VIVGIDEIARYLFQTYEVFGLLIHGASQHYLVFNRIVSFDSFSVKRFKKIRVSSVFVIFSNVYDFGNKLLLSVSDLLS
jgi:hypothetical protein